MRKILTILLLAVSLNGWATKIYIAPTGNDATGNGSSGNPYLTISKGVTEATVGDTVYIVAGTYNINATIDVPVGISIMGEGSSTILSSTASGSHDLYGYSPIFNLESTSEGTSGSQSISHMHMNGNDTIADGGIMIYRRSDVEIHNISMENFHYYGIRNRGGAAPPAVHATENVIRDCIIYNCGGPNASFGDIQIGGQEGMLIYNNHIFQPQRNGYNRAGFPIKYLAGGDNHGLKIYNNDIQLEEGDEYDEWHIAVELFGSKGGIEIYNNEFWGVVDFSDYVGSFGTDDTEGYGFAVKIHNNLFGGPSPSSQETYGVTFERGTVGGAYVYQNIFRNIRTAVALSNTQADTEDIYIYNNIIYSFGRTGSASGYGILLGSLDDARVAHFQNIHVLNNTIYDNSEGQPTVGIVVRGGTNITYDDIFIRNNIIKGIRAGDAIGIWFNKVNATDVSVENNLIHDCDHTTPQFDNCSITNLTDQNNITTDPLFVSTSDFHLQSTSPCRDAGIDVSAITGGTDFHGASLYGAAYDIGAFEYGVNRMVRIGTTMPTINYKIILIDH
jgi:hypothetical protein